MKRLTTEQKHDLISRILEPQGAFPGKAFVERVLLDFPDFILFSLYHSYGKKKVD